MRWTSLAWVLALAACGGDEGSASRAPAGDAPNCTLVEEGLGPTGEVPLRVETVVTGLTVPWGMAFLPDGALLVAERPGRLRRVEGGALLPDPVVTIEVVSASEEGLLGLALHPDFAQNRFFYMYFTRSADGRRVNRVQRFVLSADGRSAQPDAILLDDIPAARSHSGGRIAFGPDGLLYVGTGDATEPTISQDRESPAGKVLRVTADGEVPPDNPFPGSPVFLTGLRNVEGFDWLDATTMVVTDHGPSGELDREGGDELNVARAGQNLGWPTVWGCRQAPGLSAPALVWRDAVPPGGALVYRGDVIPEWRGSVLVGALGARHLHRVVLDGGRVTRHEVYLRGEPPEGFGRLRTVAQGPDGAVYVTTSNCDGRGTCPSDRDRILRITRG